MFDLLYLVVLADLVPPDERWTADDLEVWLWT